MKLNLVLAVVAAAGSAQAGAQGVESDAVIPVETAIPADSTASAPRSGSRLIEEIVVTAQKREENLMDVPISAAAFSADMLDAKGIIDPKDLPLATPGLTLGSTAGFTVTYLRGVGSDAFLMADPSVALYIDGIYFPFAHGLAQNFGAIERVEVLKGPQGTLFGRNAVGGAINVISKSPDFHDAETEVQVSYANYDDLQTRAHVNVPLTDAFALSVSALYTSADNYRDGMAGGKPLPKEISRGARVKLRWAPVETLDLTLAGFKLRQSGVNTMFATNSDPSLIGQAAGIRPQTGYDGVVDSDDVFFSLDNTVIYGQAVLNTDWFDVKLLGSDQDVQSSSGYDFDGSPIPLVSFVAERQFADVQSAEIQFISNDSSWGADWLKWIVGGYYFKSRQGFDPVILSVAGIDLGQGQVFGIDLPDNLFDNLSRLLSPLPLGLDGLPTGQIDAFGIIDTKSTAGFVQATTSVTDWFSFTLGARYQVEDREIFRSQSLLHNTQVAINLNGAGLADQTTSLKPKASLEFRLPDDSLLYFSFQQAIKSATYNVINIYDQADYVKPEKMDAYELGLKTKLFDGLMTLSAAAFEYKIKDLQVQFLSLLQGGAVTFENAGGARVRGVDFDTTVQLFPELVDDLVVTAGGAYLDAVYTDYRGASGFNEATGILTVNNDYSGNRITRTPRFSGSLGLSKTYAVVNGSLELGADYYYNSGFYYLAQNGRYEEPAYALLGLRVSYLFEPWNLRVTAFGKNVADEKYNYSRFSTDFGQFDAVAPPATYGMRLNWSF